jgi:hypothetical protein
MRNPWELEIKSREAADWMMKRWMRDFGGINGKSFGWTPWVLTAQNSDDQPVFTQGEAEQIFTHLKKKGVLYDHEINHPEYGKIMTQTFKDQLEISRFISNTGVVEMKILPFFEWVSSNKWVAGLCAALAYLFITPLGGFLSKLGELMAECVTK